MQMFIKPTFIAASLAMLSACGGATTTMTETQIEFVKTPDFPRDPEITEGTVEIANDLLTTIAARRTTPDSRFLPAGTATYSGFLKADMTVSGESDVDGIYGVMNMTAELFGAGDEVTGTVTNIHTLRGDTPVERLTGILTVTADLDDGNKSVVGGMTGELTGVFGDERSGPITVETTLTGHTHDTYTGKVLGIKTYDIATAMAGGVDGTFTGSESGEISGGWFVAE